MRETTKGMSPQSVSNRTDRGDEAVRPQASPSSWWGGDVYWLLLFVTMGAVLRLYGTVDWLAGTIAPCDFPFVDEITPLVQTRNLLHFEVFFYPPVAPILVGALSLPLAMLMPETFHIGTFCRIVTIGASVATIPLAYLIGRFWGPRVGLVAAGLFSVNMIASTSTGNVQVYSTLFVTLAIYCTLLAYHRPTAWSLSGLGAFLGLAVTTKYFPAFLFLLLFVGLVANRSNSFRVNPGMLAERPSMRQGWMAILVGVLVLTIPVLTAGVVAQESILQLVQDIYDANPHDHSFAYHLPTVLKLLDLGLLGVGVLMVCAGGLLAAPVFQRRHPWEWAVTQWVHHAVWLIPVGAAGLVVALTFCIPVAANLNNFAKYAVWTLKAYASTDGGMFPAAKPAPSYLLAYLPENFGRPGYILALSGVLLAVVRRDKKLLLLLLAALPLWIMLERSSVKVNRYVLELIPILCVAGGFAFEWLWSLARQHKSHWMASGLFGGIYLFTCLYSLAWAEFYRPGHDIPQQAASWLRASVARDASIGLRSSVLVDHLQPYLPSEEQLDGYRLVRYDGDPEYILLPKLVYAVMRQHLELSRQGQGYQDADWFPYPPPTPEDLRFMEQLVAGGRYELLKEVARAPEFLGYVPGPQAIHGYTWLREHSSYSILVYKRVSFSESANRRSQADPALN